MTFWTLTLVLHVIMKFECGIMNFARTILTKVHVPQNKLIIHDVWHNNLSKYSRFSYELTKVKKLDKKLVQLEEKDLVEKQIKGWGSGGQKTNKTANCASLLHVPTGITVRVHASRSLLDNKAIARARLRMKVDRYVKGEDSVLAQEEMVTVTRSKTKRLNIDNKRNLEEKAEEMDDIKY